jgi:light-regulated signal transduction histidine kinase (bacteriophytochrome)
MVLKDDSSAETPDSVRRRLDMITAELESSQEEAYRLARSLSHDLAAPLTSTRWMLETLRTQPDLAPESKALADGAVRNLEQMVEQIAAIMAHAAVGRKSLHANNPASTERAVSRAVANLAAAIEESGAIIQWRNLPPVLVEPDALVSLFQNLLSNAIKFRRADEAPRIEITATLQDRHSLFRVSDNGTGIDERQSARIFLPLQRLNPAIPGRGIGLATCRKIAERTGGKIWVESAPGAGSTFLFTLPTAETVPETT